jgi:hypothetical protein
MLILLSTLSVILIAGHLVSIALNRSYWPFDSYPMYSFPILKSKYPIVFENRLIMFTIVDTTGGIRRDLFYGTNAFPKEFHPLDRLETILFLVKSGLGQEVYDRVNARNPNHFFLGEIKGTTRETIQTAMNDLLRLANSHSPQVTSIAVEQLEWADFRSPNCDVEKPDKITRLIEVSRA